MKYNSIYHALFFSPIASIFLIGDKHNIHEELIFINYYTFCLNYKYFIYKFANK